MREIKRCISRRVGELVIKITPEAIIVRRFGCSTARGKSISYADLAKRLGLSMVKNRSEAFNADADGWIPVAGEQVWLDPEITGRSRGVVISVIPAAPEPLYLVRMARGKTTPFYRKNLRPCPARVIDEPMPLESLK